MSWGEAIATASVFGEDVGQPKPNPWTVLAASACDTILMRDDDDCYVRGWGRMVTGVTGA